MKRRGRLVFFFFFNDTATTEIYTLSLHDALPIWGCEPALEEQLSRVDLELALLHGAPDPVGLVRAHLGILVEVEDLVRPHRVALAVEHHHHARLEAPHQVLRDDDADFGGIELHHAAYRERADALDELLAELGG